MRKSCVVCKKTVLQKPDGVARCLACKKPYHRKCCNASWFHSNLSLCCCAIDIRRQHPVIVLLNHLPNEQTFESNSQHISVIDNLASTPLPTIVRASDALLRRRLLIHRCRKYSVKRTVFTYLYRAQLTLLI